MRGARWSTLVSLAVSVAACGDTPPAPSLDAALVGTWPLVQVADRAVPATFPVTGTAFWTVTVTTGRLDIAAGGGFTHEWIGVTRDAGGSVLASDTTRTRGRTRRVADTLLLFETDAGGTAGWIERARGVLRRDGDLDWSATTGTRGTFRHARPRR